MQATDYEATLSSQNVSIIDLQSAGASHVAPSIDPDHDWAQLGPKEDILWDPDIQIETVFRDGGVGVPHFRSEEHNV